MDKLRFILLFAVMLVAGSATAYDFEYGGLCYNVLDKEAKTVEVTSNVEINENDLWQTVADYSGKIVVPATVTNDGTTYSVVQIGRYAFHRSQITSLTISDGVESIGDAACGNCEQLVSVELPASLKTVGSSSFWYCRKLEALDLLEGLTTIGYDAFGYCSSVKKIVLPSSITSIDGGAFRNMGSLTAVISHIVEPFTIQKGVFASEEYNSSTQTSTYTPSSATLYVPAGTLEKYKAIEGWTMFSGMYEGEPSEATVGGLTYSYAKGSGYAKVVAGNYSSLSSVTIPGSVSIDGINYVVNEIGSGAFRECSNLTAVIMEDGIETIGSNAFYECTTLTNLSFPNTLKTVGATAFWNCYQLTSLVFPEGMQTIGNSAFTFCGNVKKIVLPSTLSSIGRGAFEFMGKLYAVISRIETPFNIDKSVFEINAMYDEQLQKEIFIQSAATVYVPKGTKAAYEALEGWTLFDGGIVEGDPKEETVNKLIYLYNEEDKTAKVVGSDYADSHVDKLTIPTSVSIKGDKYDVKGIGAGAFWGNGNIDSLVISSGIEAIDGNAFQSCYNLRYLELPSTMKAIGVQAFRNCRNIRKITLPSGITSLGEYAFYECLSVSSVISRIQTPFEIGRSVFASNDYYIDENGESKRDYIKSAAILYVPEGTKSTYEAIVGWNMFSQIVEGEPKEIKVGDLMYSFNTSDKTATVIAGDYSNLTSVTVPSTIPIDGDDYKVISIGSGAFYQCNSLESVTISSGVESIGGNAFQYCYGLKDVEFPNTLKSIGRDAFCGCNNLTKIEFPEGLTSIGEEAFISCNGLTKLTIPSTVTTIGNAAFHDCGGLTYVISRLSTPLQINGNVFAYRSEWSVEQQKYVETPSSAILYVPVGTKSAYQAIEGWTMFADILEGEPKEATVGELTYLYNESEKTATVVAGDYKSLNSVTIPGSVEIGGVIYDVKAVGASAFYNCSNLQTLVVESGVETIGARAFDQCYILAAIDLPTSLRTIGDRAFSNSYVMNIVIPEGVTTIGREAFSYCNWSQEGDLKLELPSTLKSIGENAFFNLRNFTMVVSRIQEPFEINKNVFAAEYWWENGIENYTKPSAVLYVPVGTKSAYEALEGWNMFETIFEGEPKEGEASGFKFTFIPASKEATLIKGDYSNMRNVTIPAKVTFEGDDYSVTGVGPNAFAYTDITSLVISEGVKTIANKAFRECHSLRSVSLPSTITKIGEEGFAYCGGIEDITIPASIETIGRWAYTSTKIKEIVIPASTKSIGENAFSDCREVTSIRVAAGNNYYDSRNNCNALIETASNILLKACPSTVIPNSVVEIGSSAFSGISSLKAITIPNSITAIRAAAFNGTGLTSVYIPSSVTEITPNPFSNCNALESIKVDANNPVYDSRNNCNAIIEKKTNTLVSGCKNTVIPHGIKIIASSAFNNVTGLDSLKIPYGVEQIMNSAISSSSISHVEIPKSVKYIESYAFAWNSQLTSVVSKIKDPSTVSCGYDLFEGSYGYNGYYTTTYETATLYVPKGTKDLYSHTSPWSNFKNIEEMDGEKLAKPTLSFDGRYVKAESTDSDVDMYYSLDESEPSIYYDGPIAVHNLGNVKVFAEKSFRADSDVETYNVEYLYDGDTLRLAKAGLMADAIKWCPNDSIVKMTVIGPISTTEFETIRTLGSLKFLNLAGATGDKLSIPDNAFANTNIVSFVAPSTLASVGSGIFSGCQQLAAVCWETDAALPSDLLSDVSNPNLLLYLKAGATAPTGVKNVITGGTATSITLSDATGNSNFYCPVAFKADKITYTRNFQQKTEVGVSRGWETIVLPFKVADIEHETNGTMVPFKDYYSTSSYKPFWLYTLEENNITAASVIYANTPYLICMPNADEYGDQYNLAGNVTFSATNVDIAVSNPIEETQGDITFVPAYQSVPASSEVYALNVNTEYKGYPAGSLFVNNFREVRPFEAYSVHPSAAEKVAASRVFTVSSLIGGDEDTTGIIDVMLKKNDGTNGNAVVRVYSLSGALVKQGKAEDVTNGLPKGIYIANGKKFVVR